MQRGRVAGPLADAPQAHRSFGAVLQHTSCALRYRVRLPMRKSSRLMVVHSTLLGQTRNCGLLDYGQQCLTTPSWLSAV